MPAVPNLPGVPALLSYSLGTLASLLTGDLGSFGQQTQWGVYDDAMSLALTAESVNAVEVRKEYRISNYPVENGAFEAYNKVETPGEYSVTFSQGGALADRTGFLTQVDALVDSLKLFSIVTPEYTVTSVNPVSYDYRRTGREGAGLLLVTVRFEEVRQTVTSQFVNTKAASGADTVDDGPVQPVPIDASLEGYDPT